MARFVKEEEFTARRNEILIVAQQLVFTKGFDQMAISDILSEMHISKGAFYHYFNSKSDLLEALVERMLDEVEVILTPIMDDPAIPALEKISLYFQTAGRWKAERKDYVLSFLYTWYADDNALFRQKIFAKTVQRITPMLARIIRQGIQEGTLTTQFSDEAANVIFHMLQGLGDMFIERLFFGEPAVTDREYQANLIELERILAGYTDALERVLGAPSGSLVLIDMKTIVEWADAAQTRRSANHEFISTVGVA